MIAKGWRAVIRSIKEIATEHRASGALGQARDGGEQDRAEHKAHDPHRVKDKTLPAGQTFAIRIVEEIGEFLVNLDHWQKPGEAGAEAPDKSVFLVMHPFHRLLQIESPENCDDDQRLSIAGNCRMCLVEVKATKRPWGFPSLAERASL
jgi:hypothetical protein